ncbi:MAG: ABC transporter permease [Thermodesulfobacteriota bacterium]
MEQISLRSDCTKWARSSKHALLPKLKKHGCVIAPCRDTELTELFPPGLWFRVSGLRSISILPGALVLSNLFDFGVAAAVLIVILAIAGIGASIYLLWLPVLLILLIFLAAGMGMLLACANLFFRDVKYIVEVILTFGIFFTPVFYEASMFGKWAPVLLLNPVGAILESINDVVVLHRAPDAFWLGYSAVWAIGGLLVAWSIFHRAEFAFAENI